MLKAWSGVVPYIPDMAVSPAMDQKAEGAFPSRIPKDTLSFLET
jgi:hypothetical protein